LDYFLREANAAGLSLRYDIDRYLYDVRVEKEILPDDKGDLEELYDRVKAKAKRLSILRSLSIATLT
jgi:hypothetical protein